MAGRVYSKHNFVFSQHTGIIELCKPINSLYKYVFHAKQIAMLITCKYQISQSMVRVKQFSPTSGH